MDGIFPANPLADFRAEHGAKVRHRLSAASPDSLSLSDLLGYASEHELQQWHDLQLDYSASAGDIRLREQIAKGYPGLGSENIVTFAGAQEAIFATYHAVLKPGDTVQAISPHFAPLHLVAAGLGAQVSVQYMEFNDQAEWVLDTDRWCHALLDVDAGAVQLAVINFPHNPTGAMVSQAELGQMVAASDRQGSWLFSDEVFRGLEYREEDRLPPVASLYERGISLGVMSKSHGLGGVRVGWVACPNPALTKRLLEIKDYLSICNGRMDEWLSLIALRNSESILQKNRQQAQQNLNTLDVNRHLLAHLNWSAPRAGILMYPQIRDKDSADASVLAMLDKTGALVLPGSCFGAGAGHFRLGYGRQEFNWQSLAALNA